MAARGISQLARSTAPSSPPPEYSGCVDGAEAIRQVIWVVMKQGEEMARVGQRASKGLLLHGAAGSGKTQLVKGMATEANATLFSLEPTQIYQGDAGSGELLLRRIFGAASAAATSILLLSHLDVMCPVRQLGRDAQARVVAQVLSLMDGAKEEGGKVIVIGTTSNPNKIDMALRRPGRLDREVHLPPPSTSQRLELLHLFLADMALDYPHPPSSAHSHPHGDEDSDANATTRGSIDTAEKARWMVMGEVSLAEIARKTIGYLPRHLKALCTHAAGAAIRRQALGKTLSGRHGVGRTAQEASYLQWPYLQSAPPRRYTAATTPSADWRS